MSRNDALSQKEYFRPQMNAKKSNDSNRMLGEVTSSKAMKFNTMK